MARIARGDPRRGGWRQDAAMTRWPMIGAVLMLACDGPALEGRSGDAAGGADGSAAPDAPALDAPALDAPALDAAGDGPIAPARSYRAAAIPIGIENVNDSPLKAARYRTLLRFVPDEPVAIDRVYFGFKLRGAACWDSGQAGYGAGDGGTLDATLVDIDPATGVPAAVIARESINACARHDEAVAELGGVPVLAWASLRGSLAAGRMYGLVVRNAHADPAGNFFSFNMPLADTALAGPHARNELDGSAAGAILGLDPREHVAWSDDGGATWRYGSDNGQYRSYMNDRDTAHPATRMPQVGFRLVGGQNLALQPYYAYSTDCVRCTTAYGGARFARRFDEVGGFLASDAGVGTLTLTNTSTGARASCTPAPGYGFRRCTLPAPIDVAAGESYTVAATGAVEIMKMDRPQRVLFPAVGTADGLLRAYQPTPAPGTNARDVPSLWAGPLSAAFPTLAE
jgi:hypothetical protein